MSVFSLADWLVARVLDAAIRGEDVPDLVAVLGIGLIVGAACVLTWLATRARWQHRIDAAEEAANPPVPAEPADPGREVPRFVEDRLARERRRPAPRHRGPIVPAHPVGAAEETQVLPSADLTMVLRPPAVDPNATTVVMQISDDPAETVVLRPLRAVDATVAVPLDPASRPR